jgi:hypothetical protein
MIYLKFFFHDGLERFIYGNPDFSRIQGFLFASLSGRSAGRERAHTPQI